MNNKPHICIRKRSLHNMPMVAHRRRRDIAILILNISTTLGQVNSSMPRQLCSQESGQFPTKQGCVGPRAGPDRYEKEKISCPHRGSNLTVQPVANRYTIYALPLPATQRVPVCLWHTVGEKIMKIILHKYLYDTNSNFAF